MCWVWAPVCPCKCLWNGGVRLRGWNRQPSSGEIKIIVKDRISVEKTLSRFLFLLNWKYASLAFSLFSLFSSLWNSSTLARGRFKRLMWRCGMNDWKHFIGFHIPLIYDIIFVFLRNFKGFHLLLNYILMTAFFYWIKQCRRGNVFVVSEPWSENRSWAAARLMWGYCVCELTLKAGMRHCGWSDW